MGIIKIININSSKKIENFYCNYLNRDKIFKDLKDNKDLKIILENIFKSFGYISIHNN